MWTNGYAMIPIRMRIVTTSRRRLFRTAHKAYKKRARAYLASFTITCFLMIKCLSCVKLQCEKGSAVLGNYVASCAARAKRLQEVFQSDSLACL